MFEKYEGKDFGESFVERYLANGFGAMTKSEIDILVFHLLSKTKQMEDLKNYEIANMLKVTETRVKYLRLHGSLRYEVVNHKKVMLRILGRVLESIQKSEIIDGHIIIALEDPVEQREFEHAAKNTGRHIKYTLNKETLGISLQTLLDIISTFFDDPDEQFKQIVQENIEDSDLAKKITKGAMTRRQRLNLVGEHLNEKSGLIGVVKGSIMTLIA